MSDNKILNLRLRENAGRTNRKELTEFLRATLDLSPEEAFAIVLEHSDEIRRRLETVTSGLRGGASTLPASVWHLSTQDPSEISLYNPSTESVFFLSSEVEKVGIFLLPVDQINAKWRLLLDRDPDGFHLVSHNLSSGVIVHQTCDWPDFVERIEIRAWGPECTEWLSNQSMI